MSEHMNEYYKKREEDIRARWFPEHVADWEQQGSLQILTWRKTGTSNYYCRYIIDGRVLIVYGDAGDAVYGWSDRLTWEFLSGLDYDYFAGKCMASERGRGYKSWDGRMVNQRLKEYFAQRQPTKLPPWEMNEPPMYHKDEWVMWLNEYGQSVFGGDYYEMENIGEVIDLRCQGHLIGIKMAFDQMKAVKE